MRRIARMEAENVIQKAVVVDPVAVGYPIAVPVSLVPATPERRSHVAYPPAGG